MSSIRQWVGFFCRGTLELYDMLKDVERLNESRIMELRKKGGVEKGRFLERKSGEIESRVEAMVKARMEMLLDSRLPEVTLHRGGVVQEALREVGAVAVTQGTDIYIREDFYTEGFEFTEAVLLHEFTHVVQHQRSDPINTIEDVQDAEKEAMANEQMAEQSNDSYFYANIGGKCFYMNKKIMKQSVEYAIEQLKRKMGILIDSKKLEELLKIMRRLENRYGHFA
jgi:hypothetical protein